MDEDPEDPLRSYGYGQSLLNSRLNLSKFELSTLQKKVNFIESTYESLESTRELKMQEKILE